MAMIALILTVVVGWMRWSGWLAIPIGLLAFVGALRANPHEAYRIKKVDIPLYCGGTFLLIKLVTWAHGWIG